MDGASVTESSPLLYKLQYEDASCFDRKKYEFIDTIKYEHIIQEVCKNYQTIGGAKNFSACINFNDSEKYYLSNDPGGIAIPYYEWQLNKIDDIFSLSRAKDLDHFFPRLEHLSPIQDFFIHILEERFGVYNTYVLVRRSDECTIFLVMGHNKPIQNPQKLHNETVKQFEDFAISFFDKTIDIISAHKPCLKYTRVISDPTFRKSLIKGRIKPLDDFDISKLSEKHIGILFWKSRGKNAQEIAGIVNLKKLTVDSYLKDIREAFSVDSTDQAILISKQKGLIF